MGFHLISDDLGLDPEARREPAEQTGPTWLDVENLLLEVEIDDRLRAEWIIDEIEGST